jgi:hypothetical protein
MKMTNKQLIKRLTPDTISEAFLLQAVEYYSHQILSDSSEWKHPFINQDLWQVIAKHNLRKIEERTL